VPWRHGLLGLPGPTRRGTTRPISELLERSGKDLDQEREIPVLGKVKCGRKTMAFLGMEERIGFTLFDGLFVVADVVDGGGDFPVGADVEEDEE
jgi:hypothetical protein